MLHAFIVVLQAGALGWMVRALKAAFEKAEDDAAEAHAARQAAEKAERVLTETTLQAAKLCNKKR